MKVVFISRYPVAPDKPKGGVESVTSILASVLADDFLDELHVLTLRHDLDEDVVEQFGQVSVHRLAVPKFPQILDLFAGPGAKKIRKKIEEIQPKIVHSHETHGLGLYHLGCPHVMTVHGFDHANIVAEKRPMAAIRAKMWKLVERYCLRRHRNIISISPYVTEKIHSLIGTNSEKLIEIDNPVERLMFDNKRHENYEPLVLCVGWINERKNTLGAIEAFAQAAKQVPGARLRIAGTYQEKKYYDRVLSLVKALDLSDSVDFLGHIDRAGLVGEMKKSAVLLLPSFQENAPMVISEAQAVGLPVIASNRCGMKYMIQSEVNGYLIEPHEIESISNRLKTLLSDRELNAEFGSKGRQHALEAYYPSKVASKTYELYQQLE